MVSSELIFLDAGLFIGALMGADRRHPEARPLVEAARRGEWMACTSVGVLAEVFAALTWVGAQPPQSAEVAVRAIRLLVEEPSRLRVLDTTWPAGLKMFQLAERYQLTARRIHDARHAATALTAGVHRVYTYDPEDWRVFEPDGMIIAGPPSVLESRSSR